MKSLKYFTATALLFGTLVSAGQKPVLISEDSIHFGTGIYPGFTVTIPEVSYEKTLGNWVKDQETGTKSKVMTENGEMTIFGAIKKEISPNPVNIYSKLVNHDTTVLLMACIELKKDQYIESSIGDIQCTAARTYLKEFAKNQYIEVIKGQLAAEEKNLKNLENDLNSLENSNTRTVKGAQKNKSTIKNEQDKLIVLNNELSQLSASIINENNLLISMEPGTARDTKALQIQDMDKRKKKLQKQIDAAENKINKSKSEIDKADRALPKNENQQERIKQQIEAQEAVVKKFLDKLNTVKSY